MHGLFYKRNYQFDMKVGFIVNSNRMAPCFVGNELWVYRSLSDSDEHEVVVTVDWGLRNWATELMNRDIEQLLCAGIDRFLCGALLGNGITVISNVVGEVVDVQDKWRQGLITDKQEYGVRGWHCGHSRKRCRRGGNRNVETQYFASKNKENKS